jgi:hypothetical protein
MIFVALIAAQNDKMAAVLQTEVVVCDIDTI